MRRFQIIIREYIYEGNTSKRYKQLGSKVLDEEDTIKVQNLLKECKSCKEKEKDSLHTLGDDTYEL